jgi:hypothetical protein
VRKMNILFCRIVFCLIGCGLFFPVVEAQERSARTGADYYQKIVAAIILKDDRVVNGRIMAFRKNGIIFDAERSGLFYDPKPAYYPISAVRLFLDSRGRVVWKNPQVSGVGKPAVRKINFKAKVGLQFGLGQHFNAYTKPASSPLLQNIVQDIKTGSQWSVDASLIIKKHYGLGIKYTQHASDIFYYGLTVPTSSAQSSSLGTQKDIGTVQTIAVNFSYIQAVSRKALFHADLALGQSTFKSDGLFLAQSSMIQISAFSVSAGSGFDFFVTPNLALGFDLSLLLGSVAKQEINGEQIDFKQNLNRVDVNVGIRYYF